MPKIALVILAAGASTRMGEPKQLLPWGNSTLLEHSVKTANSVLENVYVVLGANAELIQKQTELRATILHHINWREGLGSSISHAVKELESVGFMGVLFVLGDQPFITKDYLQSLLDEFKQTDKNIIASQFEEKLGVPAIFSNLYFDDLKKLNADEGAKSIIKKNKKDVIAVPASNLIVDVDTKKAYKKAYELFFGIDN